MAPHSSTLPWKISWTEEPGGLQSMGSLRVRHDWATSLSLFTFMHRRRKRQPTPVFLPEESQGWGSLEGAVYEVTQSRTQLKRLSSSSSIPLHRLWIINDCDKPELLSSIGTPVTRFHLASQHNCGCFWRNSGAIFKTMNTAKTLRWLFFSHFSKLSLSSSYTSLCHLTISTGCIHTWDNILFSCLTANSCLTGAKALIIELSTLYVLYKYLRK